MTSEILHVEQSPDGVTWLTLNRPDSRNALTIELMDRLCQTIHAISAQPGQRVAILRGAGPAFCSGLDLKEAAQPGIAEQSAASVARLFETIAYSPFITIAAVHGAAYAGGAGLLACCDFVVAADDLKLAFPEVRRGLVPALVAALLKERVRDADIRELFLLAEPVTAARAQAMGLIHKIVPADRVQDEANSLAQRILKGGPESIRQTKQLLRQLSPANLSQQLATALDAHKAARHSPEAAEGMSAFLQHREPNWQLRSQGG